MTTAYLYKWTHIPTNKWYIGSRTKPGCHPNDGYITSSKTVKLLVEQNPTDWVRTILVIGNSEYIRTLEAALLKSIDARNDPMSFNRHNGDGKFTTAGKTFIRSPHSEETKNKISASRKGQMPGEKNPFYGKAHSQETKEKISQANSGRVQTLEANLKRSVKLKGRIISEETRKKMSAHQIGKSWENKMCPHCEKTISVANYSRWHGDRCKLKNEYNT